MADGTKAIVSGYNCINEALTKMWNDFNQKYIVKIESTKLINQCVNVKSHFM